MRSRQTKEWIRQNAVGTTMLNLNTTILGRTPVGIPSMSIQQAIASILGSLDDKIDLNRRMNETLESMARALYKSWFVDFDPVVAKAAGKRPFGMDDAAAALFPDRFVDSELGPIPEGWSATDFGSISALHDNKRVPLSKHQRLERQGPYRYLGATGVIDYVDHFLFDGRYLLVGEDGTVITDDGRPVTQYVWGQFWVNNHAHVITGLANVSVEVLYLCVAHMDVLPYVTGAVQPKLSQKNLKSIPLVMPRSVILDAFQQTIEPLFSLFRSNADESHTLAQLRDLLLPKLLSGEIRIKDAEKVAQEVV